MSVENNVAFGSRNNNRGLSNTSVAICAGIGTAASGPVYQAFLKENRGDTFMKTIRNGAKKYALEAKKDTLAILKPIIKDSWHNTLAGLSNKKWLAIGLGVGTVLYTAATALALKTVDLIRGKS